ncbi:glycosyltransferase, partial [Arachnia propionica]
MISNGISDGLVTGPVAERSGGRRVIIVASLDNRNKDINRAVRAVAAIDGASLSIVGEGPDRAEIETLITELDVGDRVRLLGQRGDVPELLRQHDVFLSTSRVEGFGLAAAEGMAVG